MNESQKAKVTFNRELAVLFLAPGIVGVLIITSWILLNWEIGPSQLNVSLALIATILGGYVRFLTGFKDIFHRRITVNVFVTIAIIATLAVQEFLSAGIIVLIMSVVGTLESYTLDKNRNSIRGLLELAPQVTTVRREDREVKVPVGEIQIGEVIIVRPGERIPVDGVVVIGESSVNQAPITGESMPIEKSKGNDTFAGSLNESGRLEIRTTRIGQDTTLSKIVHLVEKAQATKAPVQNVADQFTKWFLPIVLILALVGYFVSGDVKIAVAVLLVACPCAFAIATPTAVTAGISHLARRSAVLVKGGIFLESAAKIDNLLVDKTGTLTFGRPKVVDVISFHGSSKQDVLSLAATAEKYSEHPLGRSVIAYAYEQKMEVPDPNNFKIKPGEGVTAQLNGSEIIVGKKEFLYNKGIPITQDTERMISDQIGRGRTVLLVANDSKVIGLVSVTDEIRPETSKAVSILKTMGINITMITGDNPRVSKSVADEIGVNDFKAELLPEQKQEFVKKLHDEGRMVGMVGDGINDAPALALAHVGISMGNSGTDVAIETANVTLMNDNLLRVVDLIWISKKVLRRIKLNIFFSIVYNAIGLILASSGMLSPILAITFQEAGCITVVLSSTLLLWAKSPWLQSKKVLAQK